MARYMRYQSNMYRYGMIFIFASLIFAALLDSRGMKGQWQWLQAQQQQRAIEQKKGKDI